MKWRSAFLLTFLFVGFSFSKTFAAECLVTTNDGGFVAGGLLTHLVNSDCTVIRFQDGIGEIKFKSIPFMTGGVQLIGRPGVRLTYDVTHSWPDSSTQNCLLHVVPLAPNFNVAPVKILNLNLSNPGGMGICFEEVNHRVIRGDGVHNNPSLLQNLVIQAGTIGIDLGSTDFAIVQTVQINGQGNHAETGIRILPSDVDPRDVPHPAGGVYNQIYDTTIRNFDVGVKLPGAFGTILERNRYLEIKNKPVDGFLRLDGKPKEISYAFVRDFQLTLTGLVWKSVLSMEVYKVTIAGDRKNYDFIQKISPDAFLSPDPFPILVQNVSYKRFIYDFAPGILQAEDTVIVNSRLLFDGTRPFSNEYNGADEANRIQGHPRCNDVGWFWFSFDRRQAPADSSLNRGWTFDYDSDHAANFEEDLNRDCRLDRGERDPFINDDFDRDGVLQNGNSIDNCPDVINPNQRDQDGDGVGDVCDLGDVDGDGFDVAIDNCPTVFNPDQRDSDNNEVGDVCAEIIFDPRGNVNDTDSDHILTANDNCPFTSNQNQADLDGDKVGDQCDTDDDNDGLTDEEELLDMSEIEVLERGVRRTDPNNPDSDGDDICDGPGLGFQANSCSRPLDNCPLVLNRGQLDGDEDGIGDACDNNYDSDKDGYFDDVDRCPAHYDRHPWFDVNRDGFVNAGDSPGFIRGTPPILDVTVDNDKDGVWNPCDSDDDNDGLDDVTESGIMNLALADPISFFQRNHLVSDLDQDHFVDGIDICVWYPNTDAETRDYLRDPKGYIPPHRCGNYPSNDLDGDGILKERDNCPFVKNVWQLDIDGDGQGDACDLDDDNDDHLVGETKPFPGVGELDPCFFYLYNSRLDPALLSLASALTPNRNPFSAAIMARHDDRSVRNANDDGIGCASVELLPGMDPRLQESVRRQLEDCKRTCDFDESANYRLHSWDSNSDRYGGRILGFADAVCDGQGIGFSSSGTLFSCKPADFCPEYYNVANVEGGSFCAPNFTPTENVNDIDSDGVADQDDNCVDIPNGDQSDIDGDRAGNVCDSDQDGDFILNVGDNCPLIFNPDQANLDQDDFGDICDPHPPLVNLAHNVQGGGCSIHSNQKINFTILSLILASIGLIRVIRQRT